MSTMKLKFEPNLDFQLQAIAAVRDLFEGQKRKSSDFTVLAPTEQQFTLSGDGRNEQSTHGIGNRLSLLEDELLANLRRVQLRHGLPPSEDIDLNDLNITVEMETGTGKTYAYLRTIHELYQEYGFTKFIIVVPSIAIKGGVKKSLEIMREHFGNLYGSPPFHDFVYDSGELGQVRSFATSPHIEVMVATIQALHKTDQRIFHQSREELAGARPIDLIRETRPVVIIDEPQSVLGGDDGAGMEAVREMNPLCNLHYSATLKNRYHMVYRLDAVDAYNQGLVKGIEVASAQVEGAHDRPFVRVVQVDKKGKSNISARLELDCEGGPDGITRKVVTNIQAKDDLEQVTCRQVYRDVRVGDIYSCYSDKRVELHVPGDKLWLEEGETFGDVPLKSMQRQMIRRTIRQHLRREQNLRPRGIKVLTLFFVDTVANYRSYDDDGQPVAGRYARIFEEEYERAVNLPEFAGLFDEEPVPANLVHDGYFSIDRNRRKGTQKWVDTYEGNQTGRSQAEEAYKLIMQDKERLLDLDTPLKFIFSHSALKEGWDNPNVFQICSLREMSSERQRRQSIGRGLRLCVNQDGVRVRDAGVNRLTVIATESVREFAAKLQEEIEQETGLKFGVVQKDSFAHIRVGDDDEDGEPLGTERSTALWHWLQEQGYINSRGKVQEKLARDLNNGKFEVPEAFSEQQYLVSKLLRKLTQGIKVRDADDADKIRVRKKVLDSPEFRALWDRIKYRTAYKLDFDDQALIDNCIEAMKGPGFAPGRARLIWEAADMEIDQAGVRATDERTLGTPQAMEDEGLLLPDILTELQDTTGLTRRSLARILVDGAQLWQFKRSPQAFIKATSDLINRQRRRAIIDGIKYERLGESDYYAMSLFEDHELMAYIGENTVEVTRAPTEHIVCESGVEKNFAQFLEDAEAVRTFAKLPNWFKIPTPLGSYNPDWAVLVATDEADRLYFVVETKDSLDSLNLRGTEAAKIHCGRRHFAALDDIPKVRRNGTPVQYEVATGGSDFMKHWG